MKIHFCDLCNESVPQSELDAGRAFMRKGRVVCAKCDQLMTQHDGPGMPPPVQAVVVTTAVVEQATIAPAGEIPVTADAGAGAGAPAVHHHHSRLHPRTQGAGGGIVVALCAMALTALSFYWLTERSDKISATFDTRMKALEKLQGDAELTAVRRVGEFDGRLLTLERSFKESVDTERKGLESRLLESQTRQDKALAPLGDMKADIAGLKSIVPSTQRHEEALIASAQRVSDLETRAITLEATIAELKQELEKKASVAATPPAGAGGAAPAPAPGAPAWMAMVAQLESRESGERWVAVTNLGDTKDPAVAEYLLPRLKDVDIFVRMATARVLGNLGSPKAIGALIEALSDQDSSVREAAYSSLCTVSKKSLPFDAHQEPGERAKRVKAWQEWWKKAQEDGSAQ